MANIYLSRFLLQEPSFVRNQFYSRLIVLIVIRLTLLAYHVNSYYANLMKAQAKRKFNQQLSTLLARPIKVLAELPSISYASGCRLGYDTMGKQMSLPSTTGVERKGVKVLVRHARESTRRRATANGNGRAAIQRGSSCSGVRI